MYNYRNHPACAALFYVKASNVRLGNYEMIFRGVLSFEPEMLISNTARGVRLGDSKALNAPASFLIVLFPLISWLLKKTHT